MEMLKRQVLLYIDCVRNNWNSKILFMMMKDIRLL